MNRCKILRTICPLGIGTVWECENFFVSFLGKNATTYAYFRTMLVLFQSYQTLLWRILNMIPIRKNSIIFRAGQSSTLFVVDQASWPWLPTEERAPMAWPPVQEGASHPGRIWSQGRLPDHLHFPRFCQWDSLQWTCKHDPPKIYVFIRAWWKRWTSCGISGHFFVRLSRKAYASTSAVFWVLTFSNWVLTFSIRVLMIKTDNKFGYRMVFF